ncbi:hypothetical protein [Cohnella panacarvi]|uniref:hypothetical protein n=1 Tax=Cohnella panacarvi TaxID=400776 RepID=UPI00047DE9F6|nr:hypothetical protein [Cohnella panacarvi]
MVDDRQLTKNDADYVLLSQIHKENQVLIRDDSMIYLSTEDNLAIGEGTEFGDTHDEVYLYAEQVTLSHTFKLSHGILSTGRMSTLGEAAFDLQGKPGMTPVEGADGTDGEDGGDLSLFIETVAADAPHYKVNASGGQGGDGKAGLSSDPKGGDGGNGGCGGNVKLFYGHPYLKLAAELRSIYQRADQDDIVKKLIGALDEYPDVALIEPFRQKLKDGASPETAKDVIREMASRLVVLADEWKSKALASTDVSGGLYGTYGEGVVNGSNGIDGERGTFRILPVGSAAQLANVQEESFFPWVHPVQCRMLFEKARLRYLCLEPSDREAVADTMIAFKRLQQKTSPFEQVDAGSALDKLWSKYEQHVAAAGSVAIFKDLYDKTVLYLNRLSQGLDYYGYKYNYVPVVSLDFCREQLNALIANFKTIQEEYRLQLQALQDVTLAKSALAAARRQAEFTVRSHKTKMKKLVAMLGDTARTIDNYTPYIARKKAIVEEKIEGFRTKLEQHFDWSWDNIFSSLGSIAFAPTSSVMWITHGAKIVYDGKTKITGADGDSINEAYLVNRLNTITKDFQSLKEGYSAMPGGSLQPDDPGAAKLIGDAEAIESLMRQVSDQIDSTELREALNDYVQTVIDRNGHIMTYNAAALLLLQTINEQQELESAIKQYNRDMIESITSVSSEYTGFVARMYFDAIAQIFEMLYLTTRAYNFWALEHTQLSDVLGGNVKEVTYAGLLNAQNKMVGLYQDAIKQFGTNCSPFPADGHKGITFKLTPLQLAFMRTNYEAMVNIPLEKHEADAKSPFAGLANVRITKVRCYLNGAKAKPGAPDSEILLNITHSGQEQLISRNNAVYQFHHDKREVPFRYDLNDETIVIDGGFGESLPGEKTPYALFGPYTTWKIEVDKSFRSRIDLSELKEVTLEFHGTCYSFHT